MQGEDIIRKSAALRGKKNLIRRLRLSNRISRISMTYSS